jgi:hypothetical protein
MFQFFGGVTPSPPSPHPPTLLPANICVMFILRFSTSSLFYFLFFCVFYLIRTFLIVQSVTQVPHHCLSIVPVHVLVVTQNSKFYTCKGPRNRFLGINSAGRYDDS